MDTYTWITNPAPRGIAAYRFLKNLKKKYPSPHIKALRIRLRFQTVYVPVFGNEILNLDGTRTPIKTRHLRTRDGNFDAVGSPDPYEAMNEIGTDRSGFFTEIGTAWIGAAMEEQREKADANEFWKQKKNPNK